MLWHPCLVVIQTLSSASLQDGFLGIDCLCGLQSGMMVCLKLRPQSWRLHVLLTVQQLFLQGMTMYWWSSVGVDLAVDV